MADKKGQHFTIEFEIAEGNRHMIELGVWTNTQWTVRLCVGDRVVKYLKFDGCLPIQELALRLETVGVDYLERFPDTEMGEAISFDKARVDLEDQARAAKAQTYMVASKLFVGSIPYSLAGS